MNSRGKLDRATETATLWLYKEGILYKLHNPHSKTLFTALLIIFSLAATNNSAWAKFTLYAQTALDIELTGFNGLTDSSLFKRSLTAGESRGIDTAYRGLALLRYAGGQSYPVIIGDERFTLKITTPAEPPSFTGTSENEVFYQMLSGDKLEGQAYSFALLMIQAKKLLESSYTIHTLAELTARKKAFHDFVRDHYDSLKHSDMVRRLIAQYFMMHEYVDYHTEGAPATDIKNQYNQAIMNGVRNWLEILKSHTPEHEVLNYCVSLYYNRSMVALASLIVDTFRGAAFCPGEENTTSSLSEDLLISDENGNNTIRLNDLKGKRIIAFVSADCPVPMVGTVIIARKIAERKGNEMLVVAPLQKLSEKHLSMNKMVSGRDILFVNDERWQQEHAGKKMRLPFFYTMGDAHQ